MDEAKRSLGLHPDLKRDHDRSFYGGLFFGLAGLAALASSVWAGLGVESRGPRLGGAVASGFIGIVLLINAYLVGVRAIRWYRRCSDVYYARRPVRMRAHPLGNEHGWPFLELHALGDPHLREPLVRIQAQVPTWDTSGFDWRIVDVYMDDDPNGPVVVETERGIVWPAPLSRRSNRLEGRLA